MCMLCTFTNLWKVWSWLSTDAIDTHAMLRTSPSGLMHKPCMYRLQSTVQVHYYAYLFTVKGVHLQHIRIHNHITPLAISCSYGVIYSPACMRMKRVSAILEIMLWIIFKLVRKYRNRDYYFSLQRSNHVVPPVRISSCINLPLYFIRGLRERSPPLPKITHPSSPR